MADSSRSNRLTGPLRRAYLSLVAAERGGQALSSRRIVVTVDAAAVARAEQDLGVPLDPSLLVLFSGDLDVLGIYDFDLTQLASLREEGQEAGVPTNLVPLGRDGTTWICTDPSAKKPRIVVHDPESDLDRKPMPVADWLEEITEQHLHGQEQSEIDQQTIDDWLEAATVEVRITATTRGPQNLYRVRHPKFGEGTVRRQEPTGDDQKLEIDFGAGGVRILLARFVERIS
ncbi:hypothetical protein [Chondromyces apiculatus]|uniref:Uncharacterized protein n=1 Tax=Chondromyces apiculatus DSM 436 TaxID=1192034 RepID=A0A017STC3_9BACT|nr:hypothetical protein [Chondromyces apiculatus]EYF00248.1 Hypothetical protein CAP_1033 [Chondromyces apiculatus DSM 436]